MGNKKSKIKEKGLKEVSDTNDTNVIDDTNDTNDTNAFVTLVVRDNLVQRYIFSDSTSDKIMIELMNLNETFTYDKIAERVGKTIDNVKQTIKRINEKNGFFDINKPDGKICHVSLSRMAIEYIKQKYEEYYEKKQKEEEFKQKQEAQEKQRTSKQEELINESKNFFNTYKKSFSKSLRKGDSVINIDFLELTEFSTILSDEILSNPEETLRTIEQAIEQLGLINDVRVRIYNLPKDCNKSIESLRSKDLNELISIHGRCLRLSDVRPQIVNAKFECPSCGTLIKVLQIEKKFREPSRCSCGRRGGFKLESKEMVDTARVVLEDLQDKTDNPHAKRISCFLKEDLVSQEKLKALYPGKEIEMIGVLKEVPVPLSTGGMSTRMELAVETNSCKELEEEVSMDNLTEEEETEIKTLADKIDKNGFDEINSSFAPDVYGQEVLKNSVILQLCGARNIPGKSGTKKKNKLNILFIGDPGVAKTVIGDFAIEVTPGSKKAVGGSASAVGITAAVVKDEYDGGWAVEGGTLVLAKDFAVIDELNNMSDDDKPKLQEQMSENTITVNKATIRRTLKAPAGILAIANPKYGIFDPTYDLVKQFNLPAPIINRFDLIFVVKDNVNREIDEMIAEKVTDRERGKIAAKYSPDFIKKFLIYIKNQEESEISDKISDRLKFIYGKLRTYKTKDLNINPRVYISLLQLCKASAKIRLSKNIEEKDIERALNILNKSYFNTPDYNHFMDTILNE
jgi:replicative DNA helicase Mcm